ncbi:unnamed protein product [marine sediment metagenome]|uniref:Phage-Barnase-EndoU-ColicinE5/D-RelE like nuclease 2 domain-containing protein n=1 Tax=marine sediment metagenome TaxID=412755 RepID=X1NLP5_9ZZZZ
MPEILDTVANPDFIIEGWQNELVALKKQNEKYLIVVYKEINKKDGFIITAYFTKKIKGLKNRRIMWKK